VLYTPNANTCTSAPYAFHPGYSTANPRGNTWSAHTYNLAFSDEIGHFESCLQIDANFNCAVPTDADRETGLDEDDDNNFCVPASDSLLIKVNGCFSADEDFDGQSYQRDWPGTNPNVKVDRHQGAAFGSLPGIPARHPPEAAAKMGWLCRRCGHHYRRDRSRCRDRFALFA
jgi:hypothetical protein